MPFEPKVDTAITTKPLFRYCLISIYTMVSIRLCGLFISDVLNIDDLAPDGKSNSTACRWQQQQIAAGRKPCKHKFRDLPSASGLQRLSSPCAEAAWGSGQTQVALVRLIEEHKHMESHGAGNSAHCFLLSHLWA